jgi:hypothetical protein
MLALRQSLKLRRPVRESGFLRLGRHRETGLKLRTIPGMVVGRGADAPSLAGKLHGPARSSGVWTKARRKAEIRKPQTTALLDLTVKLLHNSAEVVFGDVNDAHLATGVVRRVAGVRGINHDGLAEFAAD